MKRSSLAPIFLLVALGVTVSPVLAANGGPKSAAYEVELVVPAGFTPARPPLTTDRPVTADGNLSVALGDAIDPIQPSGSSTVLPHGFLTVRRQAGLVVAVEIFLNQGPDSDVTYRTDRLAVDPPVDPSGSFTLPVRLDGVEVYAEAKRGHRLVLGTISVGDVVYSEASGS